MNPLPEVRGLRARSVVASGAKPVAPPPSLLIGGKAAAAIPTWSSGEDASHVEQTVGGTEGATT